MLYIGESGRLLKTRFGEHHRAVCAKPDARHFDSGSHVVSGMKSRALCLITGSSDSRHEMRLISKVGTLHPIGTNERFSDI